MLSIEEIAVCEPSTRAIVATDHERLYIDALQARVYSRVYGFNEIPVGGPGEEMSLLESAVQQVLDRSGIDPAQIRLLVHTHTGPAIGLVGQSLPRALARRLGDQVQCFGMQHHKCVSGITALHLLERLLRAQPPDARAILLIGEVADSKDLRILDTALVGDVGCAVLLNRSGRHDRVLSERVEVHGEYARGIYLPADAAERRAYDNVFQDNLLHVICGALSGAGVSMDQVRFLLPHNVNINIWLKAIERLGLSRERVYLRNIARYGHCFSADAFINLVDLRPDLQPGDVYLMATVGVGGVFGAAVLQH
jgi:3-oxoacyl-[acyl-carrier-protein] synthase-3